MSERDPRIDPRPGDVLRWNWLIYGETTVTHALRSFVWINRPSKGRTTTKQHISTFRRWAATAEVIKRGDNA